MKSALQTRRRGLLGAIGCVAAAVALVALAPAAIAQSESQASSIQVVQVDMSTSPASIVVRAPAAPKDPKVAVNGHDAKVVGVEPAGHAGVAADSFAIVDNSATASPRFGAIQTAIPQYFAKMQPNERVGVISAGGSPQFESSLTADVNVLNSSAAKYKSSGHAAVYDSIVTAAQALGTQTSSLHSITVVTASADGGSATTPAIALAEAVAAKAPINFVILASDDLPAQAVDVYAQLAKQSGGSIVSTRDPAKLGELIGSFTAGQRSLHSIKFETDEASRGGNVAVQTDGQQLEVGFLPNGVTRGAALNQLAGEGSSGISFFQGSRGMLLVIVLGAAAAALLAYAVGSLLAKEDDGLKSVLQPYAAGPGDADDDGLLGHNALFQRAIDITSNIAERRGLLEKAEVSLERANLPLRAAEALTVYVGIVLGSIVLGFVLKRSLLWALLLGVLGFLIPLAVVNFKAKKRRKAFMKQLPDTLQLLAGTLKAGYSFMQGVEAVSQEVQDPMGSELRRVVTEAQLGRPVEEALESSAERMDSLDFAWAVMAVRIQREVGGNLSELLMTVSETMTARQRLRGEVQALTAEGRMSAIVLGALPIGLAFMLYVINPEYMGLLFSETIGRIMLVGSSILAGAGFLWMKKIIDIKI